MRRRLSGHAISRAERIVVLTGDYQAHVVIYGECESDLGSDSKMPFHLLESQDTHVDPLLEAYQTRSSADEQPGAACLSGIEMGVDHNGPRIEVPPLFSADITLKLLVLDRYHFLSGSVKDMPCAIAANGKIRCNKIPELHRNTTEARAVMRKILGVSVRKGNVPR